MHFSYLLSGNLVQLKDGTCEGKTLTGVRQGQSFTGWFLSGCYLVTRMLMVVEEGSPAEGWHL